jgi:hypothetical protein
VGFELYDRWSVGPKHAAVTSDVVQANDLYRGAFVVEDRDGGGSDAVQKHAYITEIDGVWLNADPDLALYREFLDKGRSSGSKGLAGQDGKHEKHARTLP